MWCLFKKSDNIQAIISNDDSSKHKSNQTLWNPYSEAAFTFKMIRKELPLRFMCSQMVKLLPYPKYHFADCLSGPFVRGSSYLLLFGTTIQIACHSCRTLQDHKNDIWKLLKISLNKNLNYNLNMIKQSISWLPVISVLRCVMLASNSHSFIMPISRQRLSLQAWQWRRLSLVMVQLPLKGQVKLAFRFILRLMHTHAKMLKIVRRYHIGYR